MTASTWPNRCYLAAITISLLAYGVLQERLMTVGFGTEHERFTHAVFLVFCNRVVAVCLLLLYQLFHGGSCDPIAPLSSYAVVSVANVVATTCQYEALKLVTFTTQTLAKTAKAIPVMLWGTLVIGKRYPASQYVFALVIILGCTAFAVSGDSKSTVLSAAEASAGAYATGAALMIVYLAADGYTSTHQEKLFKTYAMPIPDQMLFTTAFSCGFSLLAAVATNQFVPAVTFMVTHPDTIWPILGLSVVSAFIQLFISHVVKQHGALAFAWIMTTRQFCSILLSSVVFMHPLTTQQW